MPIFVVKPKDARGRRAKHFIAYSQRDDMSGNTIVVGRDDESAADVKARAVEALLDAFDHSSIDARAVCDGSGRVEVWILSGDPVRGYHYGRVYGRGEDNGLQRGKGQPEWHCTCMLPNMSRNEALRSMLAHMADNHAPATWSQFLFGLHETVLESIRREITDRNAARERMKLEAGASQG